MWCTYLRYEPVREGCDLIEDLNYPEDWQSILAKKDEAIASLNLQNKLLERKLGHSGGRAGGWLSQLLE